MSTKMNCLRFLKKLLPVLLLLPLALTGCDKDDNEEWVSSSEITPSCISAEIYAQADDGIVLQVVETADTLLPRVGSYIVIPYGYVKDYQEGDILDFRIRRMKFTRYRGVQTWYWSAEPKLVSFYCFVTPCALP